MHCIFLDLYLIFGHFYSILLHCYCIFLDLYCIIVIYYRYILICVFNLCSFLFYISYLYSIFSCFYYIIAYLHSIFLFVFNLCSLLFNKRLFIFYVLHLYSLVKAQKKLHNDICALLGLMGVFAMGLAYRGGKDEGWSYDEWLWLGRWVGLGEGEWVG